jgi:L-aminopeptidase/D-esterase-like protein
VRVGQAHDTRLASGVTAIIFKEPAVAAVDVRGGAHATTVTDRIESHRTIERIDAVVLSGGSAFGLDAGAGVEAYLNERRRGVTLGNVRVPMVCGAALFDLSNRKTWRRYPPYRDLGYAAASSARTRFALGTAGAGFGATTVNFKGGIGSASAVSSQGYTVGAIVAVNAYGSVTVGNGPHFWAAPFEIEREFGGLGTPASLPPMAHKAKARVGENATIALVATDAALTKPQAKQLAIMAHDGLVRAIYPAHTTADGDVIFAAATGRRQLTDPVGDLAVLGATSANVLARAVARAVFEATALAGGPPSWQDYYTAASYLPPTARCTRRRHAARRKPE